MKITNDFHKPSRATAKLTPVVVSKDEWNTKEDTGKSMKNALYVLWYAKRHMHVRLKRCQTVKNQARSLSHF